MQSRGQPTTPRQSNAVGPRLATQTHYGQDVFSRDDVVLVVAPHADDECLGVGGTIAKCVELGASVHVAVATGHGNGQSHLGPPELWDHIRTEFRDAMDVLGVIPENQHFRELPAARVADHPVWEVNRELAELVATVQPTVMFVPFPFDLHKDHREVFHALSVAWPPLLRGRTRGPTRPGI